MMDPGFQVRGLEYKQKKKPSNRNPFSSNKLSIKTNIQNHCFLIH